MGFLQRRAEAKRDAAEIQSLRQAAAEQSQEWSRTLTGEAARMFDDSRDLIAHADEFAGTLIWSLLRLPASPFYSLPGSYHPAGTSTALRRARLGCFILQLVRAEARGAVTHDACIADFPPLTLAIPCADDERPPATALLSAAILREDMSATSEWLAKWICWPLAPPTTMADVLGAQSGTAAIDEVQMRAEDQVGPELAEIAFSSYGLTHDPWLAGILLRVFNEVR